MAFIPVTRDHGLWPWRNAPSCDRNVAPHGRWASYRGLYRWGSICYPNPAVIESCQLSISQEIEAFQKGGTRMPNGPSPKEIKITFPETLQGGAYANNMVVAHTKEEFILDFLMVAPPAGIVTARVIVSPGHMSEFLKPFETTC